MNLVQQAGGQLSKPARFAPVYVNRTFTGLYTQRNPLRDPSDIVREKFYGGRPDALLGGTNVELTNRLTLARRPGLSAFSAATYPTAPDYFYSFQKITGSIDVIVDTSSALYLDNQDGTKTQIITKGAGAGQSQMLGVGSTLYFGDGVDLQKWNDFGAGTPGNNNGNATNPSWNWGIATPTSPPGLTITPTASSATLWQANTVFSTMGLIVDANSNVQQLYSVNATGTNTTQFGTTSAGQPSWNQTAGGTTTDNTITWTNQSTISNWQPNTTYRNFSASATSTPAFVYDPVTGGVFGNSNPSLASGVSGSTRPNFVNTAGTFTHDGTIKWVCVKPAPSPWQSSHVYSAYSGSGGVNSTLVEPYSLPPLAGQPLYIQSSGAGGTSTTGGTPPWASVAGNVTRDNQLIWMCLGSSARANNTAYTAWAAGQPTFSCIKDGAGNMQVCIQSGTSANSAPTFETNYGDQTLDGTVIWSCVGPSMSWAASTIWYLPSIGFSPPQSSSPYGSATVVDSNNKNEYVTVSGKSGGSTPSWNTTTGGTTSDGGITWVNVSAFSPSALSWTKGHVYAYSYAARLNSDSYNTTPPPGLTVPLGPPTGSASGAISTASPVFTITGSNTGAINTVTGIGSTDPQVDTIIIWRDADGGGSSNMFFLTEIPAPPAIGGIAQPWSFKDFIPDLATNTLPGLNTFEQAPINHENDPPPAGFLPDAYHFGHIWGHKGNTVYFSGGPDTLAGNGNEAFPEENTFSFPGTVTRCLAMNTGLLVFTVADTFIIAGGPLTASFYSQPLLLGTGLLSYNALDVHGGVVYLFSSDRQFLSIDPSAGENEVGFPIGDQLANINPANAYVTVHIAGSADKAVYIADGSTGWYRLNPNQAPDSGPVWSPFATITGGCKAVLSIQTSPGTHQLLIGSTGTNQPVLKRDLTVWSDNGTPYSSNFTMGCITLAQPGQLSELGFITLDLVRIGTAPTVSFLLNETSGTFTAFNASNVSDPPELYGATGHPTSLYSNRYYFNATMAANATPPPAWCRFVQIKVDYGASDTVQNELETLTIFGATYQEL